jgi:hypothetical protein
VSGQRKGTWNQQRQAEPRSTGRCLPGVRSEEERCLATCEDGTCLGVPSGKYRKASLPCNLPRPPPGLPQRSMIRRWSHTASWSRLIRLIRLRNGVACPAWPARGCTCPPPRTVWGNDGRADSIDDVGRLRHGAVDHPCTGARTLRPRASPPGVHPRARQATALSGMPVAAAADSAPSTAARHVQSPPTWISTTRSGVPTAMPRGRGLRLLEGQGPELAAGRALRPARHPRDHRVIDVTWIGWRMRDCGDVVGR